MNILKKLYNIRLLAHFLITIEILVEHAQVMSFLKSAPDPTDNLWNSDAVDAFDGLKKIALRFDDDAFMGIYITSIAVVGATFILYLILGTKVHKWNKGQDTWGTLAIWFVEHIIYGIGFVPIISQYVAPQYCNLYSELKSYTSLDCWKTDQMAMLEFGFIFTGIALFMAGVVAPVLKSERNGIEKRWGNESYFPGMYKLYVIGVAFLLAPVGVPYAGIIVTIFIILYLFFFECYKSLHVASMRMSVLWGSLWVFICAESLKDSTSRGSDMLAGWIPFLVFGYIIMPLKALIVKRELKVLPIEK
mmetsp:Transcript_12637/g.12720  ORF Transcript_12637/g.12720 Transcript_12637/m.12720 type:complete len:304 (+) Transcript_12637:9-920(+)